MNTTEAVLTVFLTLIVILGICAIILHLHIGD